MNVYTYAPPKNLKRLSGYIVILASAALGFFLFPSLFPQMPMRWLFQLTGLACLGVVIFITSRYILKGIVYSIIENDEGGLDFTVTEITNGGKSKVTVCRFSINNIEEIKLCYSNSPSDNQTKKEFIRKAKKENRLRFNYCPDSLSSPVCLIKAREDTGAFMVMLAPDDTLYAYLKGELDNT